LILSTFIPKPEGFEVVADRWEYLYYAKEHGVPVEAVVEKVTWPENLDTAVWELDLGGGIKGVVPASETGLADASLVPRFVGQKVMVKIKGLDRENGVAACSRREAIADAQERLFQALKEGLVIDAVVKAVLPPDPANNKPASLVVDAGGGVLVEVPRKLATRSRAHRLNELFRPGQAVKAKVVHVDPQAGAIRLSLVDAEPDPWDGLVYKRGDVVAGAVVGQAEKVVFLEVKPGVVGIAPPPLRGVLRRGDRVAAVVTSFDREKKKLHLRLRGGRLA
jgi:small subunit ribosomal protein S1